MKRLLAMALALVLTLGLAVPALAEEPLDPFYTVGTEKADPYAEYEAAHPEEIAALDADALLAGWGFDTVKIRFQDDDAKMEQVKMAYIRNRLAVEWLCSVAEEYKLQHPDDWASFDADSFMETMKLEMNGEGEIFEGDKADYMAMGNLLSEEEFSSIMFAGFVMYTYDVEPEEPDWWGVEFILGSDVSLGSDAIYYGDDYDYDYDWDFRWDDYDEPQEEPTLTLMVNGVASDVAVTAVDGVSYVDADALRAILGDKAVTADVTGPVPVRAAAQAAGWDVAWYDGGWRGVDQEIQLWDKAAFEAELAQEFGPFNDFMDKVMKLSMAQIFSETPLSGHETVEVTLTRFSTLDGNRDYKLKFTVDYVAQKGVMDVTITFDVSQLLQLYAPSDLAEMAKEGGFTVAQLTALLKAGTAELILDYNENSMAYNVPLLALVDEEEAGWQVIYSGTSRVLPDMKEWEDVSFVSAAYAKMITVADYLGAEQALSGYQSDMGMYTLFLGRDRFTTQNGKTTYSLTAQDVNRGLSAIRARAFGEEDGQHSLFKHCDLTWSIDDSGNIAMDMRLRPDMEGIAAFAALDESEVGVASVLRWLLPFFDMDITASGSGNQSHSSSRMKVHWNNVGTMEMKAQTTAGKAAKGPRQVEEVSPAPVFSADPDVVDPGFNFGVIPLPEQDG